MKLTMTTYSWKIIFFFVLISTLTEEVAIFAQSKLHFFKFFNDAFREWRSEVTRKRRVQNITIRPRIDSFSIVFLTRKDSFFFFKSSGIEREMVKPALATNPFPSPFPPLPHGTYYDDGRETETRDWCSHCMTAKNPAFERKEFLGEISVMFPRNWTKKARKICIYIYKWKETEKNKRKRIKSKGKKR